MDWTNFWENYKEIILTLSSGAGVAIIGWLIKLLFIRNKKSSSNTETKNNFKITIHENNKQIGGNNNSGTIIHGDNNQVDQSIHMHNGHSEEQVKRIHEALEKKFSNDEQKDLSEQILKAVNSLLDMQKTSTDEEQKNNVGAAIKQLELGNTDLATEIFEEILIKNNKESAEVNRHLGVITWLNNDIEKAIKNYERSTELEPDNPIGWNELGIIYQRVGNVQKSIDLFSKVLKIPNLDNVTKTSVLANLGLCYKLLNELDKSINTFLAAIEASNFIEDETLKKKRILNIFGNIGEVYFIRGTDEYDRIINESDLGLAASYIMKAAEFSAELNLPVMAANQGVRLGNISRILEEFDLAINQINQAISWYKSSSKESNPQIEEFIGAAIGSLAKTYFMKYKKNKDFNDLSMARDKFKESLDISNRITHIDGIIRNHASLCQVYILFNDFEQARFHLDSATKLADKHNVNNLKKSLAVLSNKLKEEV